MRRDGYACDSCGDDAEFAVKLQERKATRGAPKATLDLDLCGFHYREVYDFLKELLPETE